MFANAKHRAWRKGMTRATTYEEWYAIAKRLDDSQGREEWCNNVEDDTAYRYSWSFILEMLKDLRAHRENNDLLMAMAVLQQCTRKNVGGIMSDDLFSFTNCGEPKALVSEFVDEVVDTLEWVTGEVRGLSRAAPPEAAREGTEARTACREERSESSMPLESQEEERKSKKPGEDNQLLNQMVAWATLGILGREREEHQGKTRGEKEKKGRTEPGEECRSTAIVDKVPMTPAAPDLRPETKEKYAKQRILQEDYAKNLVLHEEYAKNLVLREKIKTFLRRAKSAYGRTALCLSGGVSAHSPSASLSVAPSLLSPVFPRRVRP